MFARSSQVSRINYSPNVGVFGPGNTSKSLEALNKTLKKDNQGGFKTYMQPASMGSNMRKLSLKRIDSVFINRDGGQYQIAREKI